MARRSSTWYQASLLRGGLGDSCLRGKQGGLEGGLQYIHNEDVPYLGVPLYWVNLLNGELKTEMAGPLGWGALSWETWGAPAWGAG